MKKLTTLSILFIFISLAFVAPMQVSAISVPPEPGPTSLSCEPSPLEIYHGDPAYFTVTITDNDSDDQIKIQSPKVRVSNAGDIKNKSRFSAKERESDDPESGDRTFEVSFTGGPVHDLNGTTEDTITFEATYQEASTKKGSLFVRDIKQSVSCLLVVTHDEKPTLTPSGGGFHPPEESGNKSGQLRGGAGVKPGSLFYFFDTAFENIGLFFTFNPEKKAQKALEHADERLAEAEESANENNPKAVEKAMTGYEEEISLATEKSKELKDDKKAEELLNIVSENTAKHQEVLRGVLEKVPEEAKQAILNAIEVSKRGQEEAIRQIAELKGEIEKLKKEVEELKKETDDQRADEVEKLKKEVEALKKQGVIQSAPKQPTTITQNLQVEKKSEEKPKTVTLPNGAIVEMDASGNIIRTIKEAPQQVYTAPLPITQSQTSTAIQIFSVNITPTITSAKIEWQTDKPTESKVFLSGGGLSSKVYNSESGLSTRHSASIDGLSANTDYSYEIEAVTQGVAVKKNGVFLTNNNKPTKISLSDPQSYPGLYCSKTTITVRILDQSGNEMLGQPVEVTNTYIGVTKTGTSPFVADFGFNAMREANFSLKIKSGMLESERFINVYEPNFRVIDSNQPDQADGTYIDQGGGIKLNKTATGFECVH